MHVSTQQEAHAEIKEPVGRIMRRKHPKSQIIGDPTDHVQTRLSLKTQGHTTLISEMQPKHISEAMQDDNGVKVMQEELDQFQKNDVWRLVKLRKEIKQLEKNRYFITNWTKKVKL